MRITVYDSNGKPAAIYSQVHHVELVQPLYAFITNISFHVFGGHDGKQYMGMIYGGQNWRGVND